jgi:3-dehydroquinate synthase
MDVVLVGLPGSGKSVVGKRLAQRHDASFVDLDELIERDAHRSIPEIFASEGEVGFRQRERAAVMEIGAADLDRHVRRVIATGGGTVVDPRNRWYLYHNRLPIWLDVPDEALAARLRRSRNVRPLVAGQADPVATIRELRERRERFYAAATRVSGTTDLHVVLDALGLLVEGGIPTSTKLVRAETSIGRFTLGDRVASTAILAALRQLEARRAILVSEPGAWAVAGRTLQAALETAELPAEVILLPRGEPAKRLSVVERAARELARRHVERGEAIVAVGGGALGDTAGFLAATYVRGIPLIHVPTTLVAQLDSSIGGKTGVDLPEGKNLVGAFHQPREIITDVSFLATLPIRQRRAALGEATKMAVIGDNRLFTLLETDGDAIARGEPAAFASGAVAELVERAAWAKFVVVHDDERETGGRIHLNLGHSIGHALEAAAGYRGLLHGEAVAYGLRAATLIGREMGITPLERAERIGRLLDRVGLATGRLALSRPAILAALGTDKKHAGGRLRWVLPSDTGVVVRSDVPDALVHAALDAILAPEAAGMPLAPATAGA